jgi:hypothetical protein
MNHSKLLPPIIVFPNTHSRSTHHYQRQHRCLFSANIPKRLLSLSSFANIMINFFSSFSLSGFSKNMKNILVGFELWRCCGNDDLNSFYPRFAKFFYCVCFHARVYQSPHLGRDKNMVCFARIYCDKYDVICKLQDVIKEFLSNIEIWI